MANKCSNCGFEYGEYDIYCSRCGQKINNNLDIITTAQQVYESFINENKFDNKKEKKEFEFFGKINDYKSTIFDAFAIMFLLSMVLTVFVVLLFHKQTNNKLFLEYKNLISKPTQIPLLKNPQTIEEFSHTLAKNERFLKLYLKYSKDDTEKKETIFYNYLTELSKLENITNELLISEKHPECETIKTKNILNKCKVYFINQFKNTGAKPYIYNNSIIFFYPNKKFIKKEYSKYLSKEMQDLMLIESKFNKPTSYNGIPYEKPDYIIKKISVFEKLYNNQTNNKTKEILEHSLHNDVKSILFSRNIYDTTTQEMQPIFKTAFEKFILKNKFSALNSIFMNYLDKQKNYTQDNFAKDYPYKLYDDTFDENVQNSTFKDIFAQLRKNLAPNSQSVDFAYVYNMADGRWIRYKAGIELNSNNYIISYPNEDNNVTFYNFAYSPVQEMNIHDNTTLFINSGEIYIYNHDKLSFSKVTFNGKLFNTKTLNFSDVTAIFPGINVINIDSTSGYEIIKEKVNKNANFVLLSRYTQGLKNYELTAIKGEIKPMALSNMFSVNTNEEVILSFRKKNQSEETSATIEEESPNYKIHITTIGQPRSQIIEQEVETKENTKNEDTPQDNDIEPHKPTMKPKITADENDALILPPSKNLEPMNDDDD